MELPFKNDIILFCDIDLDGTGVYYVLRHFLNKDFPVKQVTEKSFRDEFISLKDKETYKKIYICDLAVLNTCKDIIDLPNVVYINHRGCEENVTTEKLRNECTDSTSCTLLVYKKLKDKFKIPLTDQQKKLILLIDDYDSYNLQFEDSLKLHYFYSSLKSNKAKHFFTLFENGFNGFTQEQASLIQSCEKDIVQIFKNLKIFEGNIKIKDKNIKLCSVFNNSYISEICALVIEKQKCDVVINVNLNSNNLSIRKKRGLDIDLGNFAKKLFNGGGDTNVAGGRLNENFLKLSKMLYPVND